MGKRSHNRNGLKNGLILKNHSTHKHNPPFRKDQTSVMKHKAPRKDTHENKFNNSLFKEKVQAENESFKSSLPNLACTTTADKNGTFSSRKRSLVQVDFVYPKKNGIKEPYQFNKSNAKIVGDGYEADKEENGISTPNQSVSKSIEDILYPSRQRKVSEDSSKVSDNNTNNRQLVDDETSSSAEGHLSGRSVEDAVRDRIGCRPRSNSTDGELNLPQRGLCDERKVLESYRWRFDQCDVGRGKPKGFNNLGNTCYLNSTLQCLAHIPPFCQSLLTLSSDGVAQGGKGPSQGKKITLMLKNLFSRVHSANGSSGSSIAPRQIVSAVPTLSAIGSRGGYRFRPGRQEDCHEFLGSCRFVYLLSFTQNKFLTFSFAVSQCICWMQ